MCRLTCSLSFLIERISAGLSRNAAKEQDFLLRLRVPLREEPGGRSCRSDRSDRYTVLTEDL